LFTSIPSQLNRVIQNAEFGPAWQAACIQSWKDSGFRIVTLNRADEINRIHSLAPDVEFFEIPKNRSRPLIADFLAAAADSDAEIAGIVNADCLLIDQKILIGHLVDKLDGLAMAERLNLDRTTLRPTGQTCFGFDAFFFTKAAVSAVKSNANWRIGDNWWDYWLPLAFYFAGYEPKTLPSPMLMHLDHASAWDWQAWQTNFQHFLEFFRAHEDSLLDPELTSALKVLPPIPQLDDIHLLSNQVYHWLKSRKPLWAPKNGDFDDLLSRFLNALSTPQMPPPAGRRREKIGRALDRFRLRPLFERLGLR
jgi:hypothetical protein